MPINDFAHMRAQSLTDRLDLNVEAGDPCGFDPHSFVSFQDYPGIPTGVRLTAVGC